MSTHPSGRASGHADLERLQQAHQTLTSGDINGAAALVGSLLESRPDWPPAVHLAGLIARDQGDLSRAEDLMRRSLDLPGVVGQIRAEYANNLGNLLRIAGYPAQAEAVFRLALDSFELPQALLGLARTLLEVDRADEALVVLRRLKPGAGGINATVLLSEALAQTGERPQALEVLTRAGEQHVSRSSFWLALGARLGSLGRYSEAEAALRPLLNSAEAPNALIALTDLRVLRHDWQEALAFLHEGVRAYPQHVELQTRLAGLEWMLGDTEHFADRLRHAVESYPDDRAMRLALISTLTNAGLTEDAEQQMQAGRERFPADYHFAAMLATCCAETGRHAEASAHLATALAAAPELEYVREQAVIVSLLGDQLPAALEHSLWMIDRRPLGQTAWALRTLALRAAGDESWRRIGDPALVCRSATLAQPAGYASIEEFNASLAARLRARHTLTAHPLVNSVRDGTQIEIHPGSETDPVLRAFFEMIRAPINEFIASMPADASHPLFARKAGAWRMNGCWTVRLEGGAGRHVSHIHPRGWISSAYYVSVPEQVRNTDAETKFSRGGWLSFGKPPYPIAGLDATGWVQPAVGRLALFPSYQWHAVEPFLGHGERMTIAFDVLPIAS